MSWRGTRREENNNNPKKKGAIRLGKPQMEKSFIQQICPGTRYVLGCVLSTVIWW